MALSRGIESDSRPPIFCDVDGVIWLAHVPIPGSVEAVEQLRAAGHRVIFVTNNSFATESEQVEALGAIGISATGDVLTSAMACTRLLNPGVKTLVCGGPGIEEAVIRHGGVVLDHHEVDGNPELVEAIVVGFHRHFDYEIMRRAARAVRAGAQFIATNDDATYPTPQGEIPGGGSILAAIETAAGRRATVAGKPHAPMAEALVEMVGLTPQVSKMLSESVMVGDRPSTDGYFATTLGSKFALVRSGVTAKEWTSQSHPEHFGSCGIDFDLPNLHSLAQVLCAQ